MARDDSWLMGALAADDAYRGDDPPWPEPSGMGSVLGMGALVPPPRNPAAPPQGVVDMFVPNLSKPETYAPRPAELQPNAAGKVPTSDPFTTGAMSDLANMAGYAIPGPGGAAKAAAVLGLGAGRRLLVPAEEAAAKGIRAYHSSPHDFERFDASKIGTGEGAQVYGHGIYFAENPKVSGQGGEYWRQFETRFRGPEQVGADALNRTGFDRAKAIEYVKNKRQQQPEHTDTWDKTLSLLESGKPVGPRTYEVEIAARPEHLLDWDKPLAQQPDALRVFENLPSMIRYRSDQLAQSTGAGAYGSLEAQKYQIGQGRGGGKPEASTALREAGIPGIRYLDQGSRAGKPMPNAQIQYMDGKYHLFDEFGGSIAHADDLATAKAYKAGTIAPNPTFNYVMFPGTEDKIRIMKKYGLAGAVPTMGALAAQDEYRQ